MADADEPADERADVFCGLSTYRKTPDAHEARLAELLDELDPERRAGIAVAL